MYIYTLVDALEMMAKHGAVSVRWELGGWMCEWTVNGVEKHDTCITLLCCVRNVIHKHKDAVESMPTEERDAKLHAHLSDAITLLLA